MARPLLPRSLPEAIAALVACRQFPSPPARVLDLGCGQGNLACSLAAAGYQVAGVDHAIGDIALALQQAQRLGVTARFWNQDLFAALAAAAAQSYDAVILQEVIHMLPRTEWPRLFKSVWRVLAEQGILFLKDAQLDVTAVLPGGLRVLQADVRPLIQPGVLIARRVEQAG